MQKIRVIKVKDYNNLDLESVVGESKTLFITATGNLRKVAKNRGIIDAFAFADLIKLYNQEMKGKSYLTLLEIKYLLEEIIDRDYDSNSALIESVDSFFKMYSILLAGKVNSGDIILEKIKEEYTQSEVVMFELYVKLLAEIKAKNVKTYFEMLEEEMSLQVEKFDKVVFEGFMFFNVHQKLLLEKCSDKELVFIVKDNDFIIDDVYKRITKTLSRQLTIESIDNQKENKFTALAQNLFTNNKIEFKHENDINVYKPFATKEDEVRFVVDKVLSNIRADKGSIEDSVEKNAIVIINNQNYFKKLVNNILDEKNIFITDALNLEYGCKEIYYSKEDLLKDKITLDDKELNYTEKLQFAKQCRKIKINNNEVSILEFPLGKFILEIYKSISEGLSVDRFKQFLLTDWYFNKEESKSLLNVFSNLESYFYGCSNVKDYKLKVKELIDIREKTNIVDSKIYLTSVDKKELNKLFNFIVFVDKLINKLISINGSFKEHIQALVKSFESGEKILTEEENVLLGSILASLDLVLQSNSLNVNYKFFAENIKSLLVDLQIERKSKNIIALPVISMENVDEYENVFVINFEDKNFPRLFKNKYPFTKDILEIINGDLCGDKVELKDVYTNEYTLKLFPHLFKNLFNFTTNTIHFTYTDKNNKKLFNYSYYAEEIFKLIDKPLKLKETKQEKLEIKEYNNLIFKSFDIKNISLNELLLKNVCKKLYYYNLISNEAINDDFLMQFYLRGLLFNNFFKQLVGFKQEYVAGQDKLKEDILTAYNQAFDEVKVLFNHQDRAKLLDFENTSKELIHNFFKDKILTGKFKAKKFKLELGEIKEVTINNIKVYTHATLILTNLKTNKKTEFYISKLLDFLVTSSNDKKYELKHYNELMQRLEKQSSYDDRIALINFASFKINTQLNHEKYYNDGVKRVENLVDDKSNFTISNLSATPSNYCSYCRFKGICQSGGDY